MTFSFRSHWPVILAALTVLGVVGLTLAPYGGNPSVFFHLDQTVYDEHPTPAGFVVLGVPAYDGAHYYQVARNIPALLDVSQWEWLKSLVTDSYSYQRLTLPLLAFVVSLGQDSTLPWAFLLINILSLVGASYLIFRHTRQPLYAVAIALSPAAMVGLHFSLAEPLTLFLLTAFLVRYATHGRIDWLSVVLLCLAAWSREVNLLFLALLFVYSLGRRRWQDAALVLIPLAAFLVLQGWIHAIFGNYPFLMSADKRTLPFEAMIQLITGGYGYNQFTATSIPLAVLFVLPALVWTVLKIIKGDWSFLAVGALAFLGLMTTMPEFIWSSITSIGRVITPVYPLTILLIAKHETPFSKYLGYVILVIGIGAGVTLALITHPFTLSA